jgi:hypothetical protein
VWFLQPGLEAIMLTLYVPLKRRFAYETWMKTQSVPFSNIREPSLLGTNASEREYYLTIPYLTVSPTQGAGIDVFLQNMDILEVP